MSLSALSRRLAVPRRTGVLVLAGAAVSLATLAACASGGGSSSASPPSSAASAQRATAGSGAAAPAAYGSLASLSGSTMEVQDPATGQVTVTFSDSTAFTQAQPQTMADLAVGDCVLATGPSAATGSTSSAGSTAGSTAGFTAVTITITPAQNGTCAQHSGAAGGGTRPAGSGAPSGERTRTGTPSARPSGSAGSRPGFACASIAVGQISSIDGSSFVVQPIARATSPDSAAPTTTGDSASGQSSAGAGGRFGAATGPQTVTIDSATTITATVPVTSSVLAVGQCITAQGTADSTGAVAATRIAISTAGPSGCTVGTGRGGFGGGGRRGAGNAGAGTTSGG